MKREIYILSSILICTLLSGCIKKYKFTAKVCNAKLYVEVYNVNPAGVDADYLTDSTNFKMYVGSFDEEHEYITYQCKEDSVYIVKVETGSKNCHWVKLKDGSETVNCDLDTTERKTISLKQLRKQHEFE